MTISETVSFGTLPDSIGIFEDGVSASSLQRIVRNGSLHILFTGHCYVSPHTDITSLHKQSHNLHVTRTSHASWTNSLV